jgi:hypothetical protein
LAKVRHLDCPVTVVGEIVEEKHGSTIEHCGKRKPLKGGYDHFK